ncbi:MAG: hypothetical protein KA419_04120 [Acidobacteria bacterium]|nr:hypothetical protein [Acidobacteriota bacterium]
MSYASGIPFRIITGLTVLYALLSSLPAESQGARNPGPSPGVLQGEKTSGAQLKFEVTELYRDLESTRKTEKEIRKKEDLCGVLAADLLKIPYPKEIREVITEIRKRWKPSLSPQEVSGLSVLLKDLLEEFYAPIYKWRLQYFDRNASLLWPAEDLNLFRNLLLNGLADDFKQSTYQDKTYQEVVTALSDFRPVAREKFSACCDLFEDEGFETVIGRLSKNFTTTNINKINKEKESNQKELLRLKTEIIRKEDEISAMEQGQAQIDSTIINWVFPILAVTLLTMYLVPLFINKDLKQIIFSSGLLLELITVFLLTIAITMLGMSGKLDKEVLGTLLGGISGFVLSRSVVGAQRSSKTYQSHLKKIRKEQREPSGEPGKGGALSEQQLPGQPGIGR